MRRQRTVITDSNETINQEGAGPATTDIRVCFCGQHLIIQNTKNVTVQITFLPISLKIWTSKLQKCFLLSCLFIMQQWNGKVTVYGGFLTNDRWSTLCIGMCATRLCFTPALSLTTGKRILHKHILNYILIIIFYIFF